MSPPAKNFQQAGSRLPFIFSVDAQQLSLWVQFWRAQGERIDRSPHHELGCLVDARAKV